MLTIPDTIHSPRPRQEGPCAALAPRSGWRPLRDHAAQALTSGLGRGVAAALGAMIPSGTRPCEICEDFSTSNRLTGGIDNHRNQACPACARRKGPTVLT
jgi:hypothetical protein